MKTYMYLKTALLILCFFTLGACNNEEDPEITITSLNKAGEKFYPGDKVILWTSIEPVSTSILNFNWSCTGGTFSGVQGLFENMWIAPNDFASSDTIGSIINYEVTVSISGAKNNSSRTTIMKVIKK